MLARRHPSNPILGPVEGSDWESKAAFNWCPVRIGSTIYAVYRAMGPEQEVKGHRLRLSSVGHVVMDESFHVVHRDRLIAPSKAWDAFGCEDPRITEFEGKYYVFYTALSDFPFTYKTIKVAMATLEKNLEIVDHKHIVTPFDAKAMTLFPERVNGKVTVIVAVNTDRPPERIGIAQADNIAELQSEEFWKRWYGSVDRHAVDFRRSLTDMIEVGAPPLKTPHGWLLVYSHIQRYFPDFHNATFGIEVVLLDLDDPYKVVGRTREPIMVPEESYEKAGNVPDVVFPTGALMDGDDLKIFYGGADTVSCVASVRLDDLLKAMRG